MRGFILVMDHIGSWTKLKRIIRQVKAKRLYKAQSIAMSYDTLPNVKQDGRGVEMSHPEFSLGTKGTDVAQAFAETIRGKNIIITGVSPKSLGEVGFVSWACQIRIR